MRKGVAVNTPVLTLIIFLQSLNCPKPVCAFLKVSLCTVVEWYTQYGRLCTVQMTCVCLLWFSLKHGHASLLVLSPEVCVTASRNNDLFIYCTDVFLGEKSQRFILFRYSLDVKWIPTKGSFIAINKVHFITKVWWDDRVASADYTINVKPNMTGFLILEVHHMYCIMIKSFSLWSSPCLLLCAVLVLNNIFIKLLRSPLLFLPANI